MNLLTRQGISALLLCVLLVAPVLTGCNETSETAATTGTTVPPATQSLSADQTLVIGVSSDTGTMDVIAHSTSEWDPEAVIFESLVAPGYNMEPEPVLAESWERISDMEWRFYLRKGVKFHDGTDFNADAVKFSLERIQELGPSWTRLPVESITIEDEYTVLITTTESYGPLVEYFMMITTTGIVSPTAVEKYGEDFGSHPVGTGPFVFSKYVAEQSVTLVRNDDYWGSAPTLEKIVYQVIPDSDTQVLALKAGDIDVMRAVPTAAILELGSDSDYIIDQALGTRTTYWGFNTDKEYFQDMRVRQAFNYAVNRDDLVTYVLEGIGQAAGGFITPSIPGYVPGTSYPYDPDKARELLADAGWTDTNSDGIVDKDGQPLTVTLVNNDFIPQLIPIAEAIQDQFKVAGIKLEINVLEWAGLTERVANRDFDLVCDASPARHGGPDYQLMSRFHSTFNPTIHARTGYVNETIDALLDSARAHTDQDERIAMYQQIQEIITAEAAVIPLFYEMEVVAANSHISGLKAHPAIWRINLAEVSILD